MKVQIPKTNKKGPDPKNNKTEGLDPKNNKNEGQDPKTNKFQKRFQESRDLFAAGEPASGASAEAVEPHRTRAKNCTEHILEAAYQTTQHIFLDLHIELSVWLFVYFFWTKLREIDAPAAGAAKIIKK